MRRLLLLALATVVSLPASSSAAPRPLIPDARGDARIPDARWDIVSADLRTTGVTKQVRGKSVYTPTHLVATVTMADPPDPHFLSLRFMAHHDSCHGLGTGKYIWDYAGDGGQGLLHEQNTLHTFSCGERRTAASFPQAEAVVVGNSIVWSIALKWLTNHITVGSVFDDFRVYAHVQGPGFVSSDLLHEEAVLIDQGLDHRGPNAAVDLAVRSSPYVLR